MQKQMPMHLIVLHACLLRYVTHDTAAVAAREQPTPPSQLPPISGTAAAAAGDTDANHAAAGSEGRSTIMRSVRPCHEFSTLLVLREPRARLASHIHHISHHIRWLNTNATDAQTPFISSTPKGSSKPPHLIPTGGKAAAVGSAVAAVATDVGVPAVPVTTGSWRAVAPAVVDNYMTRVVLGEGAYTSPLGSLGRPHLHAAFVVMAQVRGEGALAACSVWLIGSQNCFEGPRWCA